MRFLRRGRSKSTQRQGRTACHAACQSDFFRNSHGLDSLTPSPHTLLRAHRSKSHGSDDRPQVAALRDEHLRAEKSVWSLKSEVSSLSARRDDASRRDRQREREEEALSARREAVAAAAEREEERLRVATVARERLEAEVSRVRDRTSPPPSACLDGVSSFFQLFLVVFGLLFNTQRRQRGGHLSAGGSRARFGQHADTLFGERA